MIPFAAPERENRECLAALMDSVAATLTHADVVNGAAVGELEQAIARATGRRFAIAVGSGTDAVFLALVAMGIGAGDDVLVPAFSFVATASAVFRTGARPVFVDVHGAAPPGGVAPFTIDLAQAALRVTPRTRAIVHAGMFGGIGDPAPVTAFARKYGLRVIEDAAQGFGARFSTHAAGALGDASAFSFDRQKPLGALGSGGAVTTDDADVARTVRSLRYHGAGEGGFVQLGFNSQLSTISAAALLVKLDRVEAWAARRRAIAARYDAALADAPVTRLTWPRETLHNRHKYVLLSPDRDGLAAVLATHGVTTRRHYARPLPRELLFATLPDAALAFPQAEAICRTCLSLPIYAQLTESEVDHICAALGSAFVRSAA